MHQPLDPHALAKEFSRVLRETITEEEMAEVIRRNREHRAAGRAGVCASHDFVDANMAMAEAAKRLGAPDGWSLSYICERDGHDPETCPGLRAEMDSWNAAWAMAAGNEFAV